MFHLETMLCLDHGNDLSPSLCRVYVFAQHHYVCGFIRVVGRPIIAA